MTERFYQSFDLQDLQLNLELLPKTSWANLGYWTKETASFVAANENLADHLAQLAGLDSETKLCDLGFGCGQQLAYWMERYGCKSIVAYNPSKIQYNYAKIELPVKITALAESKQMPMLLPEGAETLNAAKGPFDAIIALDAAYHFKTRSIVFKRAYGCLSSAGVLAFTDMLFSGEKGHYPPLWFRLVLSLGGIPRANQLDADAVKKQLESIGFSQVVVNDITNHVFPGMSDYLHRFIKARQSQWTWKALLRYRITRFLIEKAYKNHWLCYVSYSARR